MDGGKGSGPTRTVRNYKRGFIVLGTVLAWIAAVVIAGLIWGQKVGIMVAYIPAVGFIALLVFMVWDIIITDEVPITEDHDNV